MASPHSKSATIRMGPLDDGSLWVSLVDENGILSPMREVTWWGDIDKEAKVSVGVYAAKPDKDPKVLEVFFKDLDVKIL